jgi:hypothetical protein
MASLVRLYEDIDGCLNAEYNARAWRTPEDEGAHQVGYKRTWVSPEYDDYGVRKGTNMIKYRMEWNERLVTALNELPVEFVWTTTWREDARTVGKAMGLMHNPQRVLHPLNGFTTFPSIDWKYEAIRVEQAENPCPFIWVDDEIWNLPIPALEFMEKELGGLLIAPDPNLGLTPKHISMMKAYLSRQPVP